VGNLEYQIVFHVKHIKSFVFSYLVEYKPD